MPKQERCKYCKGPVANHVRPFSQRALKVMRSMLETHVMNGADIYREEQWFATLDRQKERLKTRRSRMPAKL